MAAILSLNPLRKLLGRSVSEGAAFALGEVAAPTAHPFVQRLINDAWEANLFMPLSVEDAAGIVAQGHWTPGTGQEEAARTGFEASRFDALTEEAITAPGLSELYELWRRAKIGAPGFEHGLRKAKLDTQWDEALKELKARILSVQDIANAVQQGHLADDGILEDAVSGDLPLTIPLTEVPIDPLVEAEHGGYDAARLKVLTNLVGLPPGDMEMLEMLNRGIITEESVRAGLREGHRKTKWTNAVIELRYAVLTAIQAVNLRLRGWITTERMHEIGAKTGYKPADMDLLFLEQGRPISPRQIFIGQRRGGKYVGAPLAPDPEFPEIDPWFLKGLKESDIRPEWYDLAWAQRHSYPSAFVLRALTQAGTLSENESYNVLLDIGWPEPLAQKVATDWAKGTAAAADPYLSKARTQLWTTTHRSFLNSEVEELAARDRLTTLGVPGTTIGEVLALWGAERSLIRKTLTPAQIRKAWTKAIVNPTTGAPWTRHEAITALIDLGYDENDSEVFLDEA